MNAEQDFEAFGRRASVASRISVEYPNCRHASDPSWRGSHWYCEGCHVYVSHGCLDEVPHDCAGLRAKFDKLYAETFGGETVNLP